MVEMAARMRIMILRYRKSLSEAHIRAVGLAVLPIVAFLLAGTATAQDQDGQWNRCTVYDEYGKLRTGASLDLAIDACTAVIQSDRESTKDLAAAFLNRGYSYNEKREYDRAVQDFDQTIRLDPNFALAFANRGNVYNDMREYDHAIRDYNQAIRLDPNFAFAFNNRCFARAIMNRFQEAVADCNESLRLRPGDGDTLDTRGLVYLKLKKLDLALADYDAALQANPKNASALYGPRHRETVDGQQGGSRRRYRCSGADQPRHCRGFRALRRACAVSAESAALAGQ
jgi:tetratricopeptide (TPR) repeat protein